MIRQIFAAALGLGLVFSVAAQQATLRDGHPDEYVVQQGDTLWDIASRFLTNPWDWPAIWQANPQIDNPHLIFPGDVISLIYVDGQPRLALNRGVERLSPRIRDVPEEDAVPTIPLEAIREYLRYPRMLTEAEFEKLPYVVANNERQLHALPGQNSYVRDLDMPVGTEVVVAQLNFRYRDADLSEPERRKYRGYRSDMHYLGKRPQHRDPYAWRWFSGLYEDDWPVIGYEMWEVARARVVKAGNPAIITILDGRREVNEGDYILPIDDYVYDPVYYPRAMDVPENAQVLTVSEDRYTAGHYSIVALNVGAADGVGAGHVFSVFRPGNRVADMGGGSSYSRYNSLKDKVELPAEYVAQVMVFRAFDKVSYALIMAGKRHVLERDILRHADERL